MTAMIALRNLIAWSVQIAILVAACALVLRVLRLRAPGFQYVLWRLLLAACLCLPLVQSRSDLSRGTLFIADQGQAVRGPAQAPRARRPFQPSMIAPDLVVPAMAVTLAAGLALRLLWLSLGLARLRRLRQDSIAASDLAVASEIQQLLGTSASIRWSGRIRQPMTFGVRRPVVLLPISIQGFEPARLRALIAHELLHVKRRDWAWQLVEEILRSVFWFHPVVWWLISRVQLAREAVVDELSILATNARRTYMDTLLALADDSPLSPVSAFSRRRHLVHRIMLLAKEAPMSSARLIVGSCCLAVVLVGSGAAAVSAFPLVQQPRDPVPGQLSPEQRGILDQAVEKARTALASEPAAPDLHHALARAIWERVFRDPAMTDMEQRSRLAEGIREEDAALAVRSDYVDALTYKNIFLRMLAKLAASDTERATLLAQADQLRNRAIAVRGPDQVPGKMSRPPEFAAEIERLKPLMVGGNVKPPRKLKTVNAVYPPEAQAARVQGVVIIEAIVDATGHVSDAAVIRSVPLLDQAALDAVKQWEYEPTLLNGAPVAVLMTVTVNFTLQ